MTSTGDSILTTLNADRPNLALRIGLSLAGAFACGAVAIFGVWVFSLGRGGRALPDEHLALGIMFATVAWCYSLWRIWRPVAGARFWIRPSLLTVSFVVAAIGGSVLIDRFAGPADDELMLAWCLLMLAMIVGAWAISIHGALAVKQVLDRDGIVAVRCPSCDYSLVGLRELRCPECGEVFTIDELIRAQNYDGATPLMRQPDRLAS